MTARSCVGLLAGCAALALLAGCRGVRERKLAEEVIRSYNRAVIEAHLTGSLDSLEKAAGGAELERVDIMVSAVRGQGQVLLASLDGLDVKSAAFEGEKAARVLAQERWTYERVDARTRQPVTPKTQRSYTMTYLLGRRGDAWVVDKVEFAAPSKELAPGEGPR